MYIPKKYGESKVDRCPFCQKHATARNMQNVPVCMSHKQETLDELKCACGSALEMLHGKFGVFFSCMKCGNMGMKKVMEINTIKPKLKGNNGDYSEKTFQSQNKKEITVRSDDPRYFD